MVFYNNRVSIADVDGKEIYLIKEYKNKLILNYYSSVGDIVESVLVEDSVGDFDISIYDDTIYLVYQDLKYYLNILILKGNEKSIHKISSDSLPKLFELNIIKHNDRISIFYLYPIDISQKIFQIKHNMLKDNKWHNFQVDEARVSQVLNPIKIIHDGEDIFLAYYYENQICLKSFNEMDGEWKESIILTDNKEKLYLDALYDGEYFYLVYSEAVDGNYIIRFSNFEYPKLIEEYSSTISRKSNSSNPTIIMKDNFLWIVWNESSRIYSRYSSDKGKTWSDIKSWDEFANKNIVRYKYTSNNNIDGTIIYNSFGIIYPDIKFIGFY